MRPATRRAGLAPALTAAITLALTAPAASAVRPAASPARHTSAARHRRPPIQHVIEIMLENHTFDNLFPYHRGRSATPAELVPAPWNEGDVSGGIRHSRAAELKAMDYQPGRGYLMDGYTRPPFGVSAVTTFAPRFAPGLHYLARHYELATRNYQPAIGPTPPNLMMAVTGTAHGRHPDSPAPHHRRWHSIFGELTARGRTWKIYLALPRWLHRSKGWYKLVPRGHRRDVTTASHFYTDLADGHLPAFSFVRPGAGYSEEPREDITEGDLWLGQLVNAVARSRYWRSTALFVTYDEGGGFADHVAPPVKPGYGTRTPMVIVSPYARRGTFRSRCTNMSILSFMQHLWRMPPLTPLNFHQNDLLEAFDVHQHPLRAPAMPLAPPDTIGFHASNLVNEVYTPRPHHLLRMQLDAETPGLRLDRKASGRVRLRVFRPRGARKLRHFPASAWLHGGRALITARFPVPGYYRVRARGPHGSIGWLTVAVTGRTGAGRRAPTAATPGARRRARGNRAADR
jgi:phospholipase C